MTRARRARLVSPALAALVSFLTSSMAGAQSAPACALEWTLSPSPNQPGGSNGLGGLAVVTAHDVWTVGTMAVDLDHRTTLTEHWDGAEWSIVESPNGPNSINFLTRATAIATGDVWAVGYSRTPGFSGISETLTEHWNGQDWAVVPSPNPQPPGDYEFSNELFGVAAVATDDVWAVGQTYDFTDGVSLIIHWDGQEWKAVDHTHPGLGSVLYGVTAVATDDVWAIGNAYFDGLQQSVIQHWDGQEWKVVESPNVGPFLNWFLSISATSATDIWGVGQHQAVFGQAQVYQTSILHWDGGDWKVVPSPNLSQGNNYLFDVVGVSATDAWAVGFWDTGTELQTMIQRWDGMEWKVVSSPNGSGGFISELVAVAKVTPTDVWAAGQAFDGFFDFETLIEQFGCDGTDPAPTITSTAPASGPAAAGTVIHIAGGNFLAGAAVSVGGSAATEVVDNDPASIDATTPDLSPGTLNDVVVTNPDTQSATLASAFFADFLDVPAGDSFHDFVEKLIRNGITAGCGSGAFCRDTAVTRAQMAVFLLKAKNGPGYTPPACTGTVFDDVPCTGGTFDPWIEALAALEVTGGCQASPPLYCPEDPVNRQQMAVFLLKSKNGSTFDPPDCVGIFDDVPCTPGVGFSDWIEQLYADGVTGGCQTAPLLYCPSNPNTRGQMAVFLVKTFGLP